MRQWWHAHFLRRKVALLFVLPMSVEAPHRDGDLQLVRPRLASGLHKDSRQALMRAEPAQAQPKKRPGGTQQSQLARKCIPAVPNVTCSADVNDLIAGCARPDWTISFKGVG